MVDMEPATHTSESATAAFAMATATASILFTLETVHETLGNDLAKTVAFFRQVDQLKPTRAAVMKRLRVSDEKSAQFVAGYEAAIVDTIHGALRTHTGTALPVRLK